MNRFALLAATLVLTVFASGARAQQADPAKVLTRADVEKVLAGTFTPNVPEPGVIFYEEHGGGYRQVAVYLFPANGKTIDSMTAQFVSQGETIEGVSGVGDAAMYRPQYKEVTVEKKDKTGDAQWLSIAVQNAASDAEAKRLAIALAKLAVERL